jgi:hypothetical protein
MWARADAYRLFSINVGPLSNNVVRRAALFSVPNARLGWFFFPEVQGGKGKANDIFGSVYGWLVSKDAPKETLEFMKALLGKIFKPNLPRRVFLCRWLKGPLR